MKKGQTIPDSPCFCMRNQHVQPFFQLYTERFSQHVQSYGIETPCVVHISEVSACEF